MQSAEVAVVETVSRVYRSQVPARVGLLGNPSDGFKGKTLSLLIKNYCATVELMVHNDPTDNTIEIVPHARFDRYKYSGFDDLVTNIGAHGYYGGIRLLQATVKTFGRLCQRVGIVLNTATGFKLTYDTTIPRMVGLSGSSAIIIATMRVLMKYYNLTIEELDVTKEQFPQLILDIEKNELDIAAGLQDRVIQSYGGLVFMDFSNPPSSSLVLDMMNDHIYCRSELALGVYKPLNPILLPCLYLAYNTSFAGDSGKVHSTVKSRWQKNDPELLEGMRALGKFAEEGCLCLENKDFKRFAELVSLNFSMRRKLYGDHVVGPKNIAVVEVANSLGLSAKFTGSGGALVCLKSDGSGTFFNEKEEGNAKNMFNQNGFEFVRIVV